MSTHTYSTRFVIRITCYALTAVLLFTLLRIIHIQRDYIKVLENHLDEIINAPYPTVPSTHDSWEDDFEELIKNSPENK